VGMAVENLGLVGNLDAVFIDPVGAAAVFLSCTDWVLGWRGIRRSSPADDEVSEHVAHISIPMERVAGHFFTNPRRKD
jgi:hypothetical protein